MENLHNSSIIEIEYPEGLDAEQPGIRYKEEYVGLLEDMELKDDPNVLLDKMRILMDKMMKCLSTSANTLGELLEERKNQVKLLEEIMPEFDKILNENDINPKEMKIMFEID